MCLPACNGHPTQLYAQSRSASEWNRNQQRYTHRTAKPVIGYAHAIHQSRIRLRGLSKRIVVVEIQERVHPNFDFRCTLSGFPRPCQTNSRVLHVVDDDADNSPLLTMSGQDILRRLVQQLQQSSRSSRGPNVPGGSCRRIRGRAPRNCGGGRDGVKCQSFSTVRQLVIQFIRRAYEVFVQWTVVIGRSSTPGATVSSTLSVLQ